MAHTDSSGIKHKTYADYLVTASGDKCYDRARANKWREIEEQTREEKEKLANLEI